ncbi:phosphatase PAP2 family protein [Ruminococcus sp. YE282]|jgi:undecaprenyl-diphosphatase|uniref:phosphatase PAP2 family protein n=1 Tax=Ruminococcus sp. YE282 TaxID=3158780 RepID=UPI00088B2F0C|nr:phosphatase PAP2 family protein [Ruminococcus bromii]SCY47396.1 undecaprenyl-diphosphatase [Ruminococcus bromii]
MFGRIKNIDNRVLEKIGKIHKPVLNKIMIVASRSANIGFIWWMVCIPFLVHPDWRLTGLNFVLALAIAHLMGEIIIKHIVKRVRPCHNLGDDEQLIDRPRFYSFPSGHTTASFAVVGVALLRCRLITFLPILVLAILIGFSRIYLRVHYLTDVIAGMILGLCCGIGSVFLMSALVSA